MRNLLLSVCFLLVLLCGCQSVDTSSSINSHSNANSEKDITSSHSGGSASKETSGGDMGISSSVMEAVNELNKKSDFLGVTLLGPYDDSMVPPGPAMLKDGKSSYAVFPYGGNTSITQIVLQSDEPNVFGLRVGQKFSEIEQVLIAEKYTRLDDSTAKSLAGKQPSAQAYNKLDITIVFISMEEGSDNPLISKIVIDIQDPDALEIQY